MRHYPQLAGPTLPSGQEAQGEPRQFVRGVKNGEIKTLAAVTDLEPQLRHFRRPDPRAATRQPAHSDGVLSAPHSAWRQLKDRPAPHAGVRESRQKSRLVSQRHGRVVLAALRGGKAEGRRLPACARAARLSCDSSANGQLSKAEWRVALTAAESLGARPLESLAVYSHLQHVVIQQVEEAQLQRAAGILNALICHPLPTRSWVVARRGRQFRARGWGCGLPQPALRRHLAVCLAAGPGGLRRASPP